MVLNLINTFFAKRENLSLFAPDNGKFRNKLAFLLLLFLSIIFAIRIWLACTLNIIPDEAYYWTWSRSLNWCYYDQPGMIAGIESFGSLFSMLPEPLANRFPILVLTFGSTILLYLIGKEIFGSKIRALTAAVFINIIPIFFAGGCLVMHDAPLIFFTLVSGFFLARLITTEKNIYLYLLAFSLAAAFYSKFTGIFAWISVFLFFSLSSHFRKWFKGYHFWFSVFLSICLVLPIFLWNYSHDWISFRVVMELGAHHFSSLGDRISSVLSYQGSQALLLTPFLYGAILIALLQGVKEWLHKKDNDFLLFYLVFAIPVILYFTLMSFHTRIQPNWAAFSYPLLSLYLVQRAGKISGAHSLKWIYRSIFWKWTGGTALVLSLLLAAHAKFCLIPEDFTTLIAKDRLLNEFQGWPELAKEVERYLEPGQVVMALRYQVASELEFYITRHPRVYCMNAFGRGNQFDFTNNYNELGGKNVLLISEYPIPEKLAVKFETIESPKQYDVKFREVRIRTFWIYNCHNFQHTRGVSLEEREKIL
jgi:4-amino-4-deoxy-L-arabinose transferase-like glycosyltransferase